MTESNLDEYFHRLLYGPPFKSGEEMQYEVLRLSSFDTWPVSAVKRPGCLAANGFYYLGSSDRVRCYACRGEIEKWSAEDDVAERHRSQFPGCPFIQQTANDNNKKIKASDGSVNYSKTDEDPGASSKADNAEELLKQMQSSVVGAIGTSGGEHRSLETKQSADEAFAAQMKDELKRRQTFNNTWPYGSSVSPEKLAKAGFYYCGPGDRVVCAFCDGKLEAWEATDDPFTEHRKQFPRCSFANATSQVNIPEMRMQPAEMQPGQVKKKSTSEEFGVVIDKPRYPQLATELSRLDTFQNWPKNLVISPIELVKAGFFYVGYADDVKCFFCGGAIRYWESGVDPWQLHAQWYSNCGFLKLSQGDEYIKEVLGQSYRNSESSESAASSISSQKTLSDFQTSVKKITKRSEATVKASEVKTNNTSSRKKKNRRRKNKKSQARAQSDEVRAPCEEIKDDGNDDSGKDDCGAEDEASVQLKEEYQRLQREQLCKICMDEKCTIVFLPCGHIVSCSRCAPALRKCPICMQIIKGSVRAYF